MTALRIVPLMLLVLLLALAAPASAQLPVVSPQAESKPNFEDDGADADDPGIWVNPLLRGRSIVVGTLKDAGLTVFDLDGDTLQDVAAPPAPGEDDAIGRFNNVDVVYGARVGKRVHDLTLAQLKTLDCGSTVPADAPDQVPAPGARIPTLDEPWTKDEFEAALVKIKEGGEFEYPLNLGMADKGEWYPYAFGPILQSFGGDIVDRSTYQTSEGALNGDAAIAFCCTSGRGAPSTDSDCSLIHPSLWRHWVSPRRAPRTSARS